MGGSQSNDLVYSHGFTCEGQTVHLFDYLPQIRQSLLRIEIVNNCSNGVNVESCSLKELVGYQTVVLGVDLQHPVAFPRNLASLVSTMLTIESLICLVQASYATYPPFDRRGV